MSICAGFGWGRIIFFTVAGHRVDNVEIFLVLLTRAYTGPRLFLLFILTHWRGKLGLHGRLRGTTARTDDSN